MDNTQSEPTELDPIILGKAMDALQVLQAIRSVVERARAGERFYVHTPLVVPPYVWAKYNQALEANDTEEAAKIAAMIRQANLLP